MVAASSESSPGPSFHFPMNEEETELWFYQHNTIVILAFVSGASFVSLIIIFALFFFCRWRKRQQVDDTGSSIGSTIVYSIEQDKVSISPAMEKHMEHILLLDDMTGLLPPCLLALRASHAATRAMAQKEILLRNVSELETVQRAIHHIPELLDAAMVAMMEPNIQPPEVEARMVGLCLGVEHLAGLLQLLGGDTRRQEVLKEVKVGKDDAKEIRMIMERGQDDEERRQGLIKDQLHVLSTQVDLIKVRAAMWKGGRLLQPMLTAESQYFDILKSIQSPYIKTRKEYRGPV